MLKPAILTRRSSFKNRPTKYRRDLIRTASLFTRNINPFAILNRAEKAVPLPDTGKITIKLGEKLTALFEVDGENLINPTTTKGDRLEANSFALDFRLHKGGRLLLLEHSFSQIIRVRCLARLKDQDVYFDTDLLPIPPKTINPELWSEQIEELVLFDFHFDGRKSEKSVTGRAQISKNRS